MLTCAKCQTQVALLSESNPKLCQPCVDKLAKPKVQSAKLITEKAVPKPELKKTPPIKFHQAVKVTRVVEEYVQVSHNDKKQMLEELMRKHGASLISLEPIEQPEQHYPDSYSVRLMKLCKKLNTTHINVQSYCLGTENINKTEWVFAVEGVKGSYTVNPLIGYSKNPEAEVMQAYMSLKAGHRVFKFYPNQVTPVEVINISVPELTEI